MAPSPISAIFARPSCGGGAGSTKPLLPFWQALRRYDSARAGLTGVNAAVVGLLLAAFYDPIWTAGITGPADYALALAALVALSFWRVPPWAVVLAAAGAGSLLPV